MTDELRRTLLIMVGAILFLPIATYFAGKRNGHRDADRWYQAHPQVKEITAPTALTISEGSSHEPVINITDYAVMVLKKKNEGTVIRCMTITRDKDGPIIQPTYDDPSCWPAQRIAPENSR
jgi:hypothetical protein